MSRFFAYVDRADFLGQGALVTSIDGKSLIAVGEDDDLDQALRQAGDHNGKPSLVVWDNVIGGWAHLPPR